MHSMIIRYCIGDGPERTDRLTSDVATLGKALEWAPQQMALRLMRDGVIETGSEMTTVSVTPVVEIPEDVRDNSQTVTDYAYMGHRSHDKGVRTPAQRDRDLCYGTMFHGYTVYTWPDVNPDGQRCRFHLVVNRGGEVVHLFHTEFFTRVMCEDCKGYRARAYAEHYVTVSNSRGGTEIDNVPLCGLHLRPIRNAVRRSKGVLTLHLSEPLIVGQHD